jgi:hypothetical protein
MNDFNHDYLTNVPSTRRSSPVPSAGRLTRRTVFKWMAATAATLQLGDVASLIAEEYVIGSAPPAIANGYGTDPKLNQIYNPGDVWALMMTPAQRATTTALADVIIPADDLGPAASAVRVPDFIDDWISAPYPHQVHDRKAILPGLDWLEAEAQKRYKALFGALKLEQQQAICDEICHFATVPPALKPAAHFFSRFRSIAAAAYYATPEGWKAIGYVGNVPTVTFDGPPPAVLSQLDIEQTVK